MSNQGNAKEYPLHRAESQSALYKRIQRLEEENAALREALKTGGYSDAKINCKGCMGPCGRCEEKGKGK